MAVKNRGRPWITTVLLLPNLNEFVDVVQVNYRHLRPYSQANEVDGRPQADIVMPTADNEGPGILIQPSPCPQGLE